MVNGDPSRIACGGACLFSLPTGPGSAAAARTIVRDTMGALHLPEHLIEDGVLAVSELATNTYQHATRADPSSGCELWIWGRTLPLPQLVISVFDTDRTAMPHLGHADLLEECGRGIAIVDSIAADWGAHPSLGRLGPRPLPGKRVWFGLDLPGPWPWTLRVVSASLASKRLVDLLRARGIDASRTFDEGVALVTTGTLDIWVEPRSFSWCDGKGDLIRHPHLDLQEVVEQIIVAIEQITGGRLRPSPPSSHGHLTP